MKELHGTTRPFKGEVLDDHIIEVGGFGWLNVGDFAGRKGLTVILNGGLQSDPTLALWMVAEWNVTDKPFGSFLAPTDATFQELTFWAQTVTTAFDTQAHRSHDLA